MDAPGERTARATARDSRHESPTGVARRPGGQHDQLNWQRPPADRSWTTPQTERPPAAARFMTTAATATMPVGPSPRASR